MGKNFTSHYYDIYIQISFVKVMGSLWFYDIYVILFLSSSAICKPSTIVSLHIIQMHIIFYFINIICTAEFIFFYLLKYSDRILKCLLFKLSLLFYLFFENVKKNSCFFFRIWCGHLNASFIYISRYTFLLPVRIKINDHLYQFCIL